MSDIKFNCPHCSQHLEAPPDIAGEAIACPTCNEEMRVPTQRAPKTPQGKATANTPKTTRRAKAADGGHKAPSARRLKRLRSNAYFIAYCFVAATVLAVTMRYLSLGWVSASVTALLTAGGPVLFVKRFVATRRCSRQLRKALDSGAGTSILRPLVEATFGCPPNLTDPDGSRYVAVLLYVPIAIVCTKSILLLGFSFARAIFFGILVPIPCTALVGFSAARIAAEKKHAQFVVQALKSVAPDHWKTLDTAWTQQRNSIAARVRADAEPSRLRSQYPRRQGWNHEECPHCGKMGIITAGQQAGETECHYCKKSTYTGWT